MSQVSNLSSPMNGTNVYPHTPTSQSSESIEEAAAKIHEEWRRKRRQEMHALGATLPVPQWKRISEDEYEAWSAALSSDVLARMHRYCEPQPTNPSAPLDGDSLSDQNAVHWCDIDQPYMYLPESWKANNRSILAAPSAAKAPCAAKSPLQRGFAFRRKSELRATLSLVCTCMLEPDQMLHAGQHTDTTHAHTHARIRTRERARAHTHTCRRRSL